MLKIRQNIYKKGPGASKKSNASSTNDMIRILAFDNSLQANIITRAGSGKIIIANSAACKLLGYSKKQLLTQSRGTIFDISESSFKKMLKQRTAEGQSRALVTVIKKNGKLLPCEITSAVFTDVGGAKNAITTIVDMSQSILIQKNIDVKQIQTRAMEIILAQSKQKATDKKNKKIVADDIILAQAKSDARLAEHDAWIKYIAKTSYDVMWDWNIATEEIYVGESIKEVFGYTIQNNTVKFIDFTSCLLPEEKAIIEKKIFKMLSSQGKTWSDSYMLRRYDGSVAATTCRASIVRDEKGKAVRLIGAIQDVSRLQELEKKLEQQIGIQEDLGEIFMVAAKLSYDVIWDWNLLTNEGFIGEGFEELFGYAIENNKGNIADWNNYLHPDDKAAVEKGLADAIASADTLWEQAYRFIKADGSVAKVFNRAVIIRDAEGKAYRMIGALQDISKQKMLEERLELEIKTSANMLTEFKESFKLIFNSSPDVLYDVDLITSEIIINDAFEKEFGYRVTGKMTRGEDWTDHIHQGDRKAVIKDYFNTLASQKNEWKYEYRFLRADNSVANVLHKGIILRKADGKAYRMIGSIHDSSKQRVLEERLKKEIKLKESQIAEAMEDAKNTARLDIGRELHDNINQLLGASRLYLDLAKRGGEQSELYFSRSSEYTLTAIEEIRKLSKDLTTDIVKSVGLAMAIENISRDTMEVHTVKITTSVDAFIEDRVNDKFKLSIFRIVQEQLNNILKHAQATEVNIGLSQNKKAIILSISDNGIGFDTRKKQQGIGVENIKGRAVHYNTTADFISQPGQGCVLTIKFPVTNTLLRKR